MKKFLLISIIIGIYYYLLVFLLLAEPISFAIEPVYLVPASYVSEFLHSSLRYFRISLVLIGLGMFFYSIYLLVGIIQKRLQNWWKTFYFTLITTVSLAYAFLHIVDFNVRYSYYHTYINYPIISVFLFSTILLFPLKEFKHLIISYIIYIISYITLIEVFSKGLLLYGYCSIAIYFAPIYILLLYLLTFQFITRRRIYLYLILFPLLIPLIIQSKTRFKRRNIPQKTVEYTMIVPTDDFYEVKKFKRPFTFYFSYPTILEPDSQYYNKKDLYGISLFPFSYFRLNLNEKRINLVKKMLNDKKIYIAKFLREMIDEKIIHRWERGNERGVVKGKIEGDIPERIGILMEKDNIRFRWNTTFILLNIKDAVSPDSEGFFEFRYVPEGRYKLLFLYKRKVPHYNIKIPLINSRNDTIDLGMIRIEK